MKERPIIFSAPMVQSLLGDGKRQTRRIVKPRTLSLLQSVGELHDLQQARTQDLAQAWRDGKFHVSDGRHPDSDSVVVPSPYGSAGDRLWVKETWRDGEAVIDGGTARVIYRADDTQSSGTREEHAGKVRSDVRWRSSLFMPRWASRILLEVVAVRIERLQDISVADAIAEGVSAKHDNTRAAAGDLSLPSDDPISSYRTLFETINGAGAWAANPWVWVVDFKPLHVALHAPREPSHSGILPPLLRRLCIQSEVIGSILSVNT